MPRGFGDEDSGEGRARATRPVHGERLHPLERDAVVEHDRFHRTVGRDADRVEYGSAQGDGVIGGDHREIELAGLEPIRDS